MPEPVVQICQSSLCRALFHAAIAALSLALVVLVQPDVFGASKGKYGTPLKFDKPPVDTGIQSNTPPPPQRKAAAEPPAKSPPAKASGKASGKAADKASGKDSGKASGGASSTAAAAGAAGAGAAANRLFGTVEFRSAIKNLPKWERVLGAERKAPSFGSKGLDGGNQKVSQRWAAAKGRLSGAPLMEKVKEVNKFFNVWPYKTDQEVWGVEDYWATPKEFVRKSGDCEDYAISKYYALRDLGVPASSMRIVALKDTIRNLGHAVLVVYAQNDAYILDNLSNMVLSHKKLPHYAPQYSVNEEYLWRHVKPKATPGN